MLSECNEVRLKTPPLRYYGGKWKIAPWIISYFPAHNTYVEPFGGGAGVLLRKDPSFIEIYNDIDLGVVNFFRVLRERPDDLVRVLELTPYSRYEFTHARGGYEDCDDLEKARRFFISSSQGRGRGGKLEEGGWQFSSRKSASSPITKSYVAMIDHLKQVACRLRRVQIECDDALAVIKRFDDPGALFYIDPPYVADTRCLRWRSDGYVNEYSDDQHRELSESLHQVSGNVVLSGYPSGLYSDLYRDWNFVEKGVVKNNGSKGREMIWMNRATRQMKLGFGNSQLAVIGEQAQEVV